MGSSYGSFVEILTPAVLLLEYGQKLLVIDPLGVIEVDRHFLAKRLVPVGDDVEQVTHRNDVADFERLSVIDQELHHDLERGPLALKHA